MFTACKILTSISTCFLRKATLSLGTLGFMGAPYAWSSWKAQPSHSAFSSFQEEEEETTTRSFLVDSSTSWIQGKKGQQLLSGKSKRYQGNIGTLPQSTVPEMKLESSLRSVCAFQIPEEGSENSQASVNTTAASCLFQVFLVTRFASFLISGVLYSTGRN